MKTNLEIYECYSKQFTSHIYNAHLYGEMSFKTFSYFRNPAFRAENIKGINK